MTTDRPQCPDHPNGPVVDARVPASDRRHWICMVCAKTLGDAPSRETTWETMTIDPPKDATG